MPFLDNNFCSSFYCNCSFCLNSGLSLQVTVSECDQQVEINWAPCASCGYKSFSYSGLCISCCLVLKPADKPGFFISAAVTSSSSSSSSSDDDDDNDVDDGDNDSDAYEGAVTRLPCLWEDDDGGISSTFPMTTTVAASSLRASEEVINDDDDEEKDTDFDGKSWVAVRIEDCDASVDGSLEFDGEDSNWEVVDGSDDDDCDSELSFL